MVREYFFCRIALTLAGYGTAGEQPERQVLPRGKKPRSWVASVTQLFLFFEAVAHWLKCAKLRGFGGRAPEDGTCR